MYRIYANQPRALINFFLQKCGAYLRAELNTIAIPLSTVFTRISAAALINSQRPQMRRLFEGGAYSSNYCNWQLKSSLQLGQIVITFRTLIYYIQDKMLLHLGLYYIQDRLLHLGLQRLIKNGLFLGAPISKFFKGKGHSRIRQI